MCPERLLRFSYPSGRISDALVEIFSFQDEKVLVGFQNTTFRGDRTSGHDVITRDHAHDDACLLTFHDGVRYLTTR